MLHQGKEKYGLKMVELRDDRSAGRPVVSLKTNRPARPALSQQQHPQTTSEFAF